MTPKEEIDLETSRVKLGEDFVDVFLDGVLEGEWTPSDMEKFFEEGNLEIQDRDYDYLWRSWMKIHNVRDLGLTSLPSEWTVRRPHRNAYFSFFDDVRFYLGYLPEGAYFHMDKTLPALLEGKIIVFYAPFDWEEIELLGLEDLVRGFIDGDDTVDYEIYSDEVEAQKRMEQLVNFSTDNGIQGTVHSLSFTGKGLEVTGGDVNYFFDEPPGTFF
jgi:hypothetical protein